VDAYQQQFDAIGDPTRRAILARLLRGRVAVGELAREFPMSRPAISQHLRILKDARLVADSAVGNRRYYSVDLEGLGKLRAYFDHFWGEALAEFKKKVEEESK
jgi:DNA-binding transcriptional ArsR family regulator